MNKKTLTSIFIIALIFMFVFQGTITTAKARVAVPGPPQKTPFYIETVLGEVLWHDAKQSNNIIVWKEYYTRIILEGGTIEGVIYLEAVGVVNLQTQTYYTSASFEIITADGTISGRMRGHYIFDPSGTTIIEIRATFIGHGYMKIKGTVDVGETLDVAVFEGYSW